MFDFMGGGDQELDVISVLNKFFDPDSPETKTQIDSMSKIRVLCEQKWFSLMFDTTSDLTIYEKREAVFHYYLVLLYSYQRKSREEVKDSVKGLIRMEEDEDKNILGSLRLK